MTYHVTWSLIPSFAAFHTTALRMPLLRTSCFSSSAPGSFQNPCSCHSLACYSCSLHLHTPPSPDYSCLPFSHQLPWLFFKDSFLDPVTTYMGIESHFTLCFSLCHLSWWWLNYLCGCLLNDYFKALWKQSSHLFICYVPNTPQKSNCITKFIWMNERVSFNPHNNINFIIEDESSEKLSNFTIVKQLMRFQLGQSGL